MDTLPCTPPIHRRRHPVPPTIAAAIQVFHIGIVVVVVVVVVVVIVVVVVVVVVVVSIYRCDDPRGLQMHENH